MLYGFAAVVITFDGFHGDQEELPEIVDVYYKHTLFPRALFMLGCEPIMAAAARGGAC